MYISRICILVVVEDTYDYPFSLLIGCGGIFDDARSDDGYTFDVVNI